jgi:hypothetical protein
MKHNIEATFNYVKKSLIFKLDFGTLKNKLFIMFSPF